MNNTTLLYTLIYFTILLIYSYISSTKIKNANDFYLGGRNSSTFTLVCSLLATILGGTAILGAIDTFRYMGWASMWFMIVASIGLVVLLPFVKQLFKTKLVTLPQLIDKQYGHKAKTIASIIIPMAWTGIIAAQIITAAKIIVSFVDIEYSFAAICSGLIFTVYTIAGGQVSILKTDKLQAIAIFTGLLMIVISIFETTGVSQFTMITATFPFNESFKPIHLFILILTYASTFTVGPDIYSRIFCVKDEGIAKKGILITAILLLICSFCIGLIGSFGVSIEGNNQSTSFVKVTEMLFSKEIHSLYIVVLLSVVLSSADTTLMSAATILKDIGPKSNLEDKKSLRQTRLYIVIIGFVSILISLHDSNIIQTLLYALTFYSGAFVIPILLSFLKIKSTERAAICAIIIGGGFALTGKIIQDSHHELFGQLIIIFAFVCNFGILISSHLKQKQLFRI